LGADPEHPVFKTIIENLIKDGNTKKNAITILKERAKGYDYGNLEAQILSMRILSANARSDQLEIDVMTEIDVPCRLIFRALEANLEDIIHLGPVRHIPDRFSERYSDHIKDRFAINAVNSWLSNDKLQSKYRLELQSLYSKKAILDRFGSNRAHSSFNKRKLKKLLEESNPAKKYLSLIDSDSQTEVHFQDVGAGISHVLPILVSAYYEADKLIAVQQPELHLHPALQAELADVFIESALKDSIGPDHGRNRFILETHSEHLLLRIMRRMRETANGSLPEGIPQICPDDVAVLYVERLGNKSIIREMPLNETGELVKAWPGGFFEEGMNEVFA